MKIDTDEFIKRATEVHGDKYDYTSTVYVKAHSKLTIVCPEHGPFQQVAKEHYKYGCKQCAIASRGESRRMTTSQFSDKAFSVHGDKYSYHLVDYKGDNKTPVDIVCPEHGVFSQKPNGHLRGEGCPRCARERVRESNAMSVEEFIKRATEVHGDKYNYGQVKYVNSNTSIKIMCPIHGEFEQRPVNHIRGAGCVRCYNDSQKGAGMTTSEYVGKAKKVHGDTFTYDKTEYNGAHEQLTITCAVHGDFNTKAVYHLQGQGCPHCAIHGFNKEKPGTVYMLVSDDRMMMKIGITNDDERRFKELRRRTPFGFHVAMTKVFANGHDAVACESHIHSLYDNANLSGFDGATEWFRLNFDAHNKVSEYE